LTHTHTHTEADTQANTDTYLYEYNFEIKIYKWRKIRRKKHLRWGWRGGVADEIELVRWID